MGVDFLKKSKETLCEINLVKDAPPPRTAIGAQAGPPYGAAVSYERGTPVLWRGRPRPGERRGLHLLGASPHDKPLARVPDLGCRFWDHGYDNYSIGPSIRPICAMGPSIRLICIGDKYSILFLVGASPHDELFARVPDLGCRLWILLVMNTP